MDDHYGTDVFADPTIKGRLDVNSMKANQCCSICEAPGRLLYLYAGGTL